MKAPRIRQRPVTVDKWTFTLDEYAESGVVEQGGLKAPVGVGWIPRGGLTLREVYNGGFRLAHDIGVTGLWVRPGPQACAAGFASRYLVLGPPHFRQLDENYRFMKPTEEFNAVGTILPRAGYSGFSIATSMDVYNAVAKGELAVRWRSTAPLFGPGSGYLFVTQRFILTDYSTQPPHEATANLLAARLHPITEIRYEHALEGWVDAFRIDYRLHANLDSWWYEDLRRTGSILLDGAWGIPERRGTSQEATIDNCAGLFRDDPLALPSLTRHTVADVVFEAAEKPLKFEVVADGLNPALGHKVWDNVHWWGVNHASASVAPSTPGAFHALHMHWRWGLALQLGPWWTPSHAGDTQFKGKGNGGILVDPRIDRQTLRLAVIKNEGLPDDLNLHSSEQFEDFFVSHRGKQPDAIEDGADLILYLSFDVPAVIRSFTPAYNAWKILVGEVFVHGLFFAHEPEHPSWATGRTGPLYINPSADEVPDEWVRNPKLKK